MTWLPVVERELRAASRRAGTYRIRFWSVLAIFVFFAWQVLKMTNGQLNSRRAGMDLFQNLVFWCAIFSLLIGVVATSDSVSQEKREGTLGLLFLTDLKGYDVILGKLVAHSINGFYALVAILPILGMPLLMGGVSLLQFSKEVMALLTAIVFSLSAGIFISTCSRSERKALVYTFLVVALITCAPFVIMIWLDDRKIVAKAHLWKGWFISPGFAIGMAFDTPPFWPAWSYWLSIAWSWLSSFLFLGIAARIAPRSWTEAGKKATSRNGSAKARRSAVGMSHCSFLDQNPFLWLALRGEASAGRVWLFILALFGIWCFFWARVGSIARSPDVIIPAALIMHTTLKIWAAGEASRRFVEDRRNGAMEFLLSTPLTEWDIIHGQWQALRRQFLWPIVFILVWEIAVVWSMFNAQMMNTYHPIDEFPLLFCMILFLPLDFVTLGWSGMWLGMTSKSRGRAMLFALSVVIVLPIVLAYAAKTLSYEISRPTPFGPNENKLAFAVFLVIFSVLTDALFASRSRRHLLTGFRQMAVGTTAR
jgi:ABC-type transport system involved in multi-copper enzyme maturation permease subunit